MAINFDIDVTMHDPASYGSPEEFAGRNNPVADVLGNYFNNEDERNHGRGRAALGAVMVAGVLTGAAGLSFAGSGERVSQQTVAAYNIDPSSTDATTASSLDTSTSSSTTSTSEATSSTTEKDGRLFEQPGVIGEAPCGPKVDSADVLARFEKGEIVIKPAETAKFFDANPEVEKAKSDFYTQHYGEAFIKWEIENKPVINPSVLKTDGTDNSVARELMARMQAAVLEDSVEVQNHQCDVTVDAAGNKVATIDQVNNITVLQKGEQVWSLEYTQKDLDKMKADGVAIPEELVMINPVDRETADEGGIAAAIAAERIACNNPLLDREHPPEVTTTTGKNTTTSAPHHDTTTTLPHDTTTTTQPSTTTTNVGPKVEEPPVPGGPSTTVEKPKPGPSTPTTSTTAAPTTLPHTTTTRAGNGTTTTSAPGAYHPTANGKK